MEDFIYYNGLFDIYGCLLTEKEQNTFRDYYQEDMSLAEIADENNVSRSAVQKTVKTVLDKLKYYEDKLNIYVNNRKMNNILNSNNISEIKQVIQEILGE